MRNVEKPVELDRLPARKAELNANLDAPAAIDEGDTIGIAAGGVSERV